MLAEADISSRGSGRKLKFRLKNSSEPPPSVFSASLGVVADLPLFVVWGALSARQEGQCPADFHFITGRRKQSAAC